MARLMVCLLVALTIASQAISADDPATEIQVHANLPYAGPKNSDKRLTSLDLYTAKQGHPRPIMVWIHGGGWALGDKAPVQDKPRAFVERGFILASVNYRLFPAVRYKAQAGDIAKAIRWLHDHAVEYGGDPNQVYVMGHSSGAHLAALTATDERYLKSEKLPLTTIKGVILLDGSGYDIPKDMENLTGPSIRFLYEGVFGTEEAGWNEASPITHVAPDRGIPPFLVFHAGDREESKLQSEGLAKALKNAGVSARVIHSAQKTHATLNQEFGQLDDEPTRLVFEFVDGIRAKTGGQ